jgi:hypothetical protein
MLRPPYQRQVYPLDRRMSYSRSGLGGGKKNLLNKFHIFCKIRILNTFSLVHTLTRSCCNNLSSIIRQHMHRVCQVISPLDISQPILYMYLCFTPFKILRSHLLLGLLSGQFTSDILQQDSVCFLASLK